MKNIYINGQVYTGKLPLVSAFAEENGKFLFAGSDEEAKKLAAEGDSVTDLEGRFVCSGFNDSHMHLLNYGQALLCAQLDQHTGSLREMIDYFKAFAASGGAGESGWIRGRGWNQDYYSDVHRMPNRFDLDEVSSDRPVVAVRCCGHCLCVNSRALEILGLDENTVCPEGGCIEKENGKLTGCFFDNAMDLVYDRIPVPTGENIKEMIRVACKAMNSYGLTSCQSDDFCVFRTVDPQTIIDAYRELEASGELTVRVYEQNNITTPEELKKFIANGNRTGEGTTMYKSGPLKMLGDGSLGARTAFLSEPYEDAPDTCGFPVFSQEKMNELISLANAEGMQVAVHAIGDGCLDYILNAVEKALQEHPREDHRHGIVHCQITRPDQLERLIRLKMHIYAQSIFLDYDNHIVEERVGKKRAASSYSWKTLMKGGLSVSNGTDCPVELPDALASMQCAVTRTTLRDHVGPYLPEEAFTVQEALDSYTIRSAEGSFEEAFKGRIAPGYLADFVILEDNIFEVPAEKIKDINVNATYLAGRAVYKR